MQAQATACSTAQSSARAPVVAMASAGPSAANDLSCPIQSQGLRVYALQSREAQEEQWILANLSLVKHIVQKVFHNMSQTAQAADMEELISAGTLGLVKAARGFDPARDVEFRTYAYIRVKGAVIDELRGRSFVPAAVHNRIREVRETYRRMTAINSRPPSDEELAAQMNLPVDELYALMEDARRRHFLRIHGLEDEPSQSDSLVLLDKGPTPGTAVERKELLENLASAIMKLPPRDRQILMLYYERDLTMKEAAAVLHVTESRISQLHASALVKLSALMEE